MAPVETPAEKINPYEAPSVRADAVTLAPDTEFLVSEKYVAGGNSIDLPAVCIATGATVDLSRKRKRLRYVPSYIQSLRSFTIIGLLLGGPILTGIVDTYSSKLPGFPLAAAGKVMIALSAIALALLFVAGVVLRETVTVQWYLSRQVQKRCSSKRKLVVAIALTAVAGAWAAISTGVAPALEVISYFIAVVVISSLLPGTSSLRIPAPQLLGKADGLYVLAGFSDAFLTHLRQMITRHDLALQNTMPGNRAASRTGIHSIDE